MGIVDDVIREKLHSHVLLIRQVSEYIINSGGKRLRPALVILSAGAFGYSGKFHYNLAAVIEFIHTATLLMMTWWMNPNCAVIKKQPTRYLVMLPAFW